MNAVVDTHFDNPTSARAVSRVEVVHPPLNKLHPGVLGIAAGAYVAMIAVFWLGFAAPGDHYLPLVIFSVVLAAFVGVPWLMARDYVSFWRRHNGPAQPKFGSFRHFLNSTVETGGGKVTGKESLVLVALIPIALTAGLIAMAVIMHTV